MSGIGEIVMSGRMQKGCYGYVRSERRFQLWKTIILFLLPLALFFGGWITTGSRTTLLTVVAVLGMLPVAPDAAGLLARALGSLMPSNTDLTMASISFSLPAAFFVLLSTNT